MGEGSVFTAVPSPLNISHKYSYHSPTGGGPNIGGPFPTQPKQGSLYGTAIIVSPALHCDALVFAEIL